MPGSPFPQPFFLAGGSALRARGIAARTAHTPEGGRGSVSIKAQSPLAKILGCSITWSWLLVRTRPLWGQQGRPLAASQPGARLPLQIRPPEIVAREVVAAASSGWCTMRISAARQALARRGLRRSALAIRSMGRLGQRCLRAMATSTPARPDPTTQKWSEELGSWLSRKANAGSRGLMGTS